MRIKIVAIIVFVLGSLLLMSEESKEKTNSSPFGKQTIKVALYEFGMFYDNGIGIDKDIIDELQKRTNCKFEVQVMARARIWSDIESGNLDMTVSGVETPERNKYAWFAHYLISKNYALINMKVGANIKNSSEFMAEKKLQFGVVTSFKHGEEQDLWLDKMRKENRVQDTPDTDSLFLKLKNERVDGIFAHPIVYKKYVKDLGLEKSILIQDWTPDEKGVKGGLVLSKKRFSEEEANKWIEEIKLMKKDGTLKKIMRKYLSEKEANNILEF